MENNNRKKPGPKPKNPKDKVAILQVGVPARVIEALGGREEAIRIAKECLKERVGVTISPQGSDYTTSEPSTELSSVEEILKKAREI